MEHTRTDFAFVAITILLVWGTVAFIDIPQPSGQAARTIDVPHIQLISPNTGTTVYSPVQKFSFQLNEVDYTVWCGFMLNGEPESQVQVSPGETGTFTAELPTGYYEWRVECRLINGRTISSQEWDMRVKPYQELGRDASLERESITGMAVNIPDARDDRGLIFVILAIGGLVWAVNIAKKNS